MKILSWNSLQPEKGSQMSGISIGIEMDLKVDIQVDIKVDIQADVETVHGRRVARTWGDP